MPAHAIAGFDQLKARMTEGLVLAVSGYIELRSELSDTEAAAMLATTMLDSSDRETAVMLAVFAIQKIAEELIVT